MIARIWKGAVRKQDGDAYAQYMQQTGVADYAKTPGNRGVWMLRRNVDDRTEFMMFTLWDSLEAVKAFAGDDYETAVSTPRTSGSWSSVIVRPSTTRSTPTPDRMWRDWRDTPHPSITAVLRPGLQPRGRGEHVGFVVLSCKLVPTLHCGIEHRAADDPGRDQARPAVTRHRGGNGPRVAGHWRCGQHGQEGSYAVELPVVALGAWCLMGSAAEWVSALSELAAQMAG
jgi:heme-degrading monooxygenase HmoA